MKKQIRKLSLMAGATPVQHLGNLSAYLAGAEIHIKRDDLTSFGFGGNKVRKLEYLMADAIDKGATDIVTMGAIQSNHCRQTAAVAATLGLPCHIVLTPGALSTHDFNNNGNIVLDKILGATFHYCPADHDPEQFFETVVQHLAEQGRKPYSIPIGGSNPLGSLGYYDVIAELSEQVNLSDYRAIIVTTGSAGTHAGLAAGISNGGYYTEVIGISCSQPVAVLEERVQTNIKGQFELLNLPASDIRLTLFDDYVGEGYGKPTEAGIEAIRLCAQKEGLFLDPVYTGKAMSGLIDLIQKSHFSKSDKVLFIHTGGSPSLFAYREQFLA